jgi:hypothetical protein
VAILGPFYPRALPLTRVRPPGPPSRTSLDRLLKLPLSALRAVRHDLADGGLQHGQGVSKSGSVSLEPDGLVTPPASRRKGGVRARSPVLVFAATEQERAYVARERGRRRIQARGEVSARRAFEKAQAATGSGIAPPVDEMNQLLMGLVIAAQRSFHLLADRIEQIENAKAG